MLLSAGRTVNNHSNRHNLSASSYAAPQQQSAQNHLVVAVLTANAAATLNVVSGPPPDGPCRKTSEPYAPQTRQRTTRSPAVRIIAVPTGSALHGQAASSLKLDAVLIQQVQHDLTNQARSLVVQGDAAQVNVVVGFLAGGETVLRAPQPASTISWRRWFTGFFTGRFSESLVIVQV